MTTDGLETSRANVLAARERLGSDLDRLDAEVRQAVSGRVQQMVWKAMAAGVGFGAAFGVRKALTLAWRNATRGDPPEDPSDPAIPWRDAVAWSLATAVGIALAQLLAQRGADAGWRRLTGTPPPGHGAPRRT